MTKKVIKNIDKLLGVTNLSLFIDCMLVFGHFRYVLAVKTIERGINLHLQKLTLAFILQTISRFL